MSEEEPPRRSYKPEIEKLPRARCVECGVAAVLQLMKRTGMIRGGSERYRCKNEVACRRRQRMTAHVYAKRPK